MELHKKQIIILWQGGLYFAKERLLQRKGPIRFRDKAVQYADAGDSSGVWNRSAGS